MALIARAVALVVLLSTFVFGCGGPDEGAKLQQVIPPIPANTDFGSLYPQLNALLNTETPDVRGAIEATKKWADEHLDHFSDGSCARAQVVYDYEFAKMYGPYTLGVTLPWMQIYVRDGHRSDESFFWQDASLFVSTVLHEYVHAMQRARQARDFLLTPGTDQSCEPARGALSTKRGTWNTGFAALRASQQLGSEYSAAEKALLYRWISPIERARDELEASALTVKWMSQYPDELNLMTMGGATNWVYGTQFLEMLKTLSTSNCFSGDEGTYGEERHIYEAEIPEYASILGAHQEAMDYFLYQHGREPAVKVPLSDLVVAAQPTGRDGHGCTSFSRNLPEYPLTGSICPLSGEISVRDEPFVSAH